jgi:hypothetical protein
MEDRDLAAENARFRTERNALWAENTRMRQLLEEASAVIDGIYAAVSSDGVDRMLAARAAGAWQGKVDAMRAMEEEAGDRV